MKHFVTMLFVSLLFWSCTDKEEFNSENSSVKNNTEVTTSKISSSEAIEIAKSFLGKSTTRSLDIQSPVVNYITNNLTTRSNAQSDTVAYVINFEDNKGFAIISSKKIGNPVLAFSEEGSFSFDNEIVMENFINRIPEYVVSSIDGSDTEIYNDFFDTCYRFEPSMQVSLSQFSPWNKYVVKDHPDCPVGCVALATALIMTHTKGAIVYHEEGYPLKAMITAIKKEQSKTNNYLNEPSQPGDLVIPYYMAEDYMAKLLYEIGKDLDMNYSPTGSGTDSKKAWTLLFNLGFDIPTTYDTYNLNNVIYYLSNNYIIYLRGAGNKDNHAWVADGCYYCVDPFDESIILDAYIYCDWGWGGNCNGYYTGAVFDVGKDTHYNVTNYFPVKKEY